MIALASMRWCLLVALAGCGRVGLDQTRVDAADAAAPPAAPRYVQSAANNAGYPAGSPSVTVNWTAATAAGDLVVLSFGWGNINFSVVSVADDIGSTFTEAITEPWPTYGAEAIYYANVTAAEHAVTVTFNGEPGTFLEARTYEYANAHTLDATQGMVSTSTALAVEVTTHADDELVFGIGQTLQDVVLSAGGGFSGHPLVNGGGVLGEQLDAATAGAYAVTETASGSTQWVMVAATFLP
jgi:hypothetical protein